MFVIISIAAFGFALTLTAFMHAVIVMKREDRAASRSRTHRTATAAISQRAMGLHVIDDIDQRPVTYGRR
ncbi:hypothetical protein [Herbidospora mongoliensis]|uniref:hypothetical protein n=1 Tax=Herbidospora mongoliensis TaxID=688067 RepID=UPI0008368EBC|nr:hypothetical protein [Herbidospora mongoliensis]